MFLPKRLVTTRVLARTLIVTFSATLFGCPVSSLEKEKIENIAQIYHAEGGTGLRTEYYDVLDTPVTNAFTKNSTKVRVLPSSEISFYIPNDSSAAPVPELGKNSNYAIRWTGYFIPPKTGNYYLCTCSDDGIRVILDGNHIIDGNSYQNQGERLWGSPNLNLEVNQPYPIRIDYFQATGPARAQLFFVLNSGASTWEDACYSEVTPGTKRSDCHAGDEQNHLAPGMQLVTKNFLVPADGSGDASIASCYPPAVSLSEAERADPNDADVQKALKLFERLAGTKVTVYDPRVKSVAQALKEQRFKDAARIVSEDNGFLDITVRKFAAKMSTRAEVNDVPLNDFISTVVGVTRDRVDARQLLVGNFLYRGKQSLFFTDNDLYSSKTLNETNNHYAQVEGTGVPLKCALGSMNRNDLSSLPAGFEQKLYSPNGVQINPDPGGLLTSRSFAEAHMIAGTNRRAREKAYEYFLCAPKDAVRTTESSDMYIRRDVERFPSGPDSLAQFRNECASCHTNIDAEAGAFAAFHYENGVLKYAPFYMNSATNAAAETMNTMRLTDSRNFSQNPNNLYGAGGTKLPVAWKYNHNVIYADGRFTTDSKWVNLFADTQLGAKFGFTMKSGEGVREYGKMLALSQAFPQCMAMKVFAEVCKQDPFSKDFPAATKNFLADVGDDFASAGYDLRDLFETLAASCL